jgi:phosphonate transport system ATP-binding protein
LKLDLQAVSARHPAARAGAEPALRALSLTVAAGEQVAVIGPSGAGKTTLLQALAASLPPQGGRVMLDGADPWSLPRPALQRLRGRLFLAPQTPPLPPRQRAVTAVLAGRLPAQGLLASLRSLIYPSDIAGAHAALARLDLGEKLFERVDRLSGGERQRVGLARGLMSPASLWLIDEPLSALDPARAALAMTVLTAEARQRGVTLVATLHQVDMALRHFPRIVGLRDGALAFDLPAAQVTPGLLAQLYAQHEHELHGPAPAAEPTADAALGRKAAPLVVQCR